MIRERLAEKGLATKQDFRWRGTEVSRIEGFSDAVFAFAVTLLVVSLEVPRTFKELRAAFTDFFAFGICFFMLMVTWFYHYRFFRRYGSNDSAIGWINALLLFVILFYVYPLKFLFTMLIKEIMGMQEEVDRAISAEEWPTLMIVYGLGFIAVHAIFALLYWRAYRKREHLELNSLETAYTVQSLQIFLLLAGVGLLSVFVAATRIEGSATYAGLIYMLTPVVITIHSSIAGIRRRKLEEGQV